MLTNATPTRTVVVQIKKRAGILKVLVNVDARKDMLSSIKQTVFVCIVILNFCIIV